MQQPAARWTVPLSHEISWILIQNFGVSALYAAIDTNKLSTDAKDWTFDATTQAVAALRIVFFIFYSYVEKIYIPNHAEKLGSAWGARWQTRAKMVKSIIPIVGFSSRWNETVVQPFNQYYEWSAETVGDLGGKAVASAYLFVNNFAYFFYLVPMWSGPLYQHVQNKLVRPKLRAEAVYEGTQSVAAAMAVYAAWDLVVWNTHMSIGNFITGMFPSPADKRFARFPDCTACFMGTNLVGRNGLLVMIWNADLQTKIALALPFIVFGGMRYFPLGGRALPIGF